MPFVISCPGCGVKIRVPDSKASEWISCPKCNVRFAAEGAPPPPAVEKDPFADFPDPPGFESDSDSEAEAPPTHCLGCGRKLRNMLICGTCTSAFCSEICLNRHNKIHERAYAGEQKRRSDSVNAGCFLVALGVVFLFCLVGICSGLGHKEGQQRPVSTMRSR